MSTKRAYRDLHEHIAELEAKGLLVTVDRRIDKDSELHALVRWQFVGGHGEPERKAFLFTNIVDGRGRKYDMPVVVGAIAANRAIYSVGMGAPLERDPGQVGPRHRASDPAARQSRKAACHEVVLTGQRTSRAKARASISLPIPISTPGFDSAPTLTATNVITRDPETGIAEHGHLSLRVEGSQPPRGAHGDARRRRGRLPALRRAPEARRSGRCPARSCSAARLT